MTNMILRRQIAARKNKKKGFTLIELIVVIVIIAIIAAIAVPALTRYIESANKRAAQATAHNLQVVLQAETTDFYDAVPRSTSGTIGAATPLFDTAPPAGFPAGYLNTVIDVLAESGVYIADGSLSDIVFTGSRLDSFIYTHNNDAKIRIWYEKGVFSFEAP